MKTYSENIQSIIRDLAIDNFNAYPECYPTSLNQECLDNLDLLAESYWDNRTEEEIKRDENAISEPVTLEDYKNWVLWCFEATLTTEE